MIWHFEERERENRKSLRAEEINVVKGGTGVLKGERAQKQLLMDTRKRN